MVVVCESCSTRFRIDDARIPAKGRMVRCSKCKATFIAKPESATPEDVIEEVVAEVTGSGGAPVPEATDDLFDAPSRDLGETATRPAGPSADEERWEFDEEPPREGGAAEPRAKAAAAPPAPSELDEIGDPAEWDLLRGSLEGEAKKAQFVEPPLPLATPAAREPERAAPAAAEPFLRPIASESESASESEAESARAERRPRREAGGALGGLGRVALTGAAWGTLALLLVASAQPLVAAAPAAVAGVPAARTIGLADGEAREVRGRFVDNAFARDLFVVQGELARPAGDARLGLRVHFVDALGVPVGTPAWAGVRPEAGALREWTPQALADALDASAPRLARGGSFAAVFAEVPAEAADVAVSLEPLPPSEASPPEPAAEATASSAPSTRPASE